MERFTCASVEPELGLDASASAPVLVATDGRYRSDAVVRMGRALSKSPTALRVVTVVEPRPASSDLPPAISTDIDAARRAKARARAVAQLERTLPEWSGLELLEGDLATSVTEAARGSAARLIVCGLGRHPRWHRLFADETALHLIRQANVPVYAVAEDASSAPTRIVAAIDFSESSIRAARLAVEVAGPGSTIYLVHIVSRGIQPGAETGAPSGRRDLPAALEHVRRQLRIPADMTVHNVFLRGEPAQELLAFADVVSADLFATGSHGRGFVRRALLGSVATQILRNARCSVLSVSPTAGARLEAAHAGKLYVIEHPEWARELETFSEMNRGRRGTLDVDDPDSDADAVEMDWPLVGAVFDPHDRRLALMFGDGGYPGCHLTHTIAGVTSVIVARDESGRDTALSVAHGAGRTWLTFTS